MKKQRRIKIELVIPATIRETDDKIIITSIPKVNEILKGSWKILPSYS